jgi:TorA maturation chaperone TorD
MTVRQLNNETGGSSMQFTGIRKEDNDSVLNDFSPSENAAIAKTQAELYGFLAKVFNCRPDIDFVRTLRGPGTEFLKKLSDETEVPAEVSLGWREMAVFVEASAGKSDMELEQELAVDWTRLFRGISPQYGPTPPYEGAYLALGKRDVEHLQSLIQFYRESGALIEEGYRDRPDYIGLEISFLCHMAQTEAEAWETGDLEQARLCQQRIQTFITEHLGLWAARFLKAALDRAETEFYKGFLNVCAGLIPDLHEGNL